MANKTKQNFSNNQKLRTFLKKKALVKLVCLEHITIEDHPNSFLEKSTIEIIYSFL